ncbi:MAG: hypothetical protein U9N18_05360 [Campylobacterota bacterium]|nr:hypothetical protein [Campylobacterota bacterium]
MTFGDTPLLAAGLFISDAHFIFKGFKKIIDRRNFKKSIFIMGRSLGSIQVIELAFHHQKIYFWTNY